MRFEISQWRNQLISISGADMRAGGGASLHCEAVADVEAEHTE